MCGGGLAELAGEGELLSPAGSALISGAVLKRIAEVGTSTHVLQQCLQVCKLLHYRQAKGATAMWPYPPPPSLLKLWRPSLSSSVAPALDVRIYCAPTCSLGQH